MNQAVTVETRRENTLRVAIILIVAAFFLVAVHQHLFNVNSHYYYTWKWRWISSGTVYPILLPLAIPFFVGQIIYLWRPSLRWTALACVSLSTFAIMVCASAIQKDPPSFSQISDVVQSRWSTGYFDSAVMVVHKGMPIRQLLAQYPSMLDHFYLHPRQKPPGALLFEIAIVRLFGDGIAGATVSGWLIAALASLSVVSTYIFIACFTENRPAAFLGASYFALCPSLLLFFPDFDTCFPNLTALVTVLWALSLKTDRIRFAILFGVGYAAAGFITYLPGVLIVFLIGYTWLKHRSDTTCTWSKISRQLAVAAASFAASYIALWIISGFNPVATLIECSRQVSLLWQKLIDVYHYPHHSLPWTFFTDLYDFALGSGWISFLIAGFLVISAGKRDKRNETAIALVSISQFVAIAAIGLLQTESARIWIFMYPFLMLPIGLELARWRPWQRMAVYAVLLLLTAATCQSMTFIGTAM